MRDILSLTVGLVLGATAVSVVYLGQTYQNNKPAPNMVPIEQCIAALIAPRGNPQ